MLKFPLQHFLLKQYNTELNHTLKALIRNIWANNTIDIVQDKMFKMSGHKHYTKLYYTILY